MTELVEMAIKDRENFAILFAWTYCLSWEANGRKINDLKAIQILEAFRESDPALTPTASLGSQG